MKIRDVELINMGFESAKKRSNFAGNACEIFPQGVWAASTYVVYQYDDIINVFTHLMILTYFSDCIYHWLRLSFSDLERSNLAKLETLNIADVLKKLSLSSGCSI